MQANITKKGGTTMRKLLMLIVVVLEATLAYAQEEESKIIYVKVPEENLRFSLNSQKIGTLRYGRGFGVTYEKIVSGWPPIPCLHARFLCPKRIISLNCSRLAAASHLRSKSGCCTIWAIAVNARR